MSLSNYNTRSYHRALPHQNSSKSAWKLDTFIDKSSGQSREIIVLADTPSPTPNSGPKNKLAVCTSQSPPPNRHSYSLIHSLSQAIQSTVKSKRKYENYSSGQQREETREAKRHEPERLPVDDKEGHYIVGRMTCWVIIDTKSSSCSAKALSEKSFKLQTSMLRSIALAVEKGGCQSDPCGTKIPRC
ncbi:hypothetical protein KEM48_006928 [Puccinia striiformis f. sp. tritici PST-130]|nr:hypothetical protein KEM48_006928 [Puccinia striiformis f. sp. tritici PST-130]